MYALLMKRVTALLAALLLASAARAQTVQTPGARAVSEDCQSVFVFRRSNVIEVGVPSIQQHVDSAIFNMLNDSAVVFRADLKIRVPSQRWHSKNRIAKIGRSDGSCVLERNEKIVVKNWSVDI